MFAIDLPLCGAQISFLFLLGLGAVVGVLGGFFGVGGGWIVTPCLNIFGLPMTHAVGTGLGCIMGMTCVSSWEHRKRGNIDVRLGLIIGLTMIVGVQFGKKLMMALDQAGKADPVVRGLYIVFLLGLGGFMLWDTFARGRAAESGESGEPSRKQAPLQRLQCRPMVRLPKTGIVVSLWPLLAIGLLAGFLSGILGVGGGFMLMPIMVYLIGVPTVVAVGSSLFCLLLSSPFGVLTYSGALTFIVEGCRELGLFRFLFEGAPLQTLLDTVRAEGRVEFVAAGIMILGAVVGAPIGVYASHVIKGRCLRCLYGVMIILGGVSVTFRQLGLERSARGTIMGAAGGMVCLIIVLTLVRRAAQLAEGPAGDPPTAPPAG